MAKEIFMPKLSSTMSVGTLLEWFKEEGDPVEIGDPLFEILTDKIEIEVEAYDQGILLKKYYQEDDEIPVNQIIGYIGEEGETVPETSPGLSGEEEKAEETEDSPAMEPADSKPQEHQAAKGEKPRATPAARAVARNSGLDLAALEGSGPKGRIHRKDVLAHLDSAETAPKATPLARKIAGAEGIDLSAVTGSGQNGKIVKDDLSSSAYKPQTETASVKPARRKLSGMRKVIADRMAKSAYTAPHVTITSEIEMTKVKELRAALLPVIEKQTGLRLSFTDILIKAAGTALARHPNINVSIDGEYMIEHTEVNIGLAVAVEDGLMVPVIKEVNGKGLAELTKDAKEIGKRARENKLLPDQMNGSTFTISNLGMYAVDAFTPIINQPDSAILGVGRIQDKPAAVTGTIEIRPMMTLSLSFDHRIIDGAPAAAFLTELKQILENPFELLV